MKISSRVLARKYAQAFFNVYGSVLTPEHYTALQQAAYWFKNHTLFLFFLKLAHITPEHKQNALMHVCTDIFAMPVQFTKLITLLVDHKRSFLIKKVIQALIELYQKAHNIEKFTIESSHPLRPEQCEAIVQFLTEQSGKIIHYTTRVNPELIAGIRAESDEHLWERSIRQKLRALYDISVQERLL